MQDAATDAGSAPDELIVDRQHMPFLLDRGVGGRARIGLIVLASDQTIEYEFRRMLNLPGVGLYESRIYNAAAINPQTLKDMERGIARATELILPGLPLDVVAYACTSGAMIIGEETVHARIRDARPGIACTTPMEATFAALEALGSHRIAFVAPYVDELNRKMRSHIQARGFGVPVMGAWNLEDDNKVARISEETIRDAVLELGAVDAVDTVFVACTSLRLADRVEALEGELGKPVTSSNHALAWHCLRLAGYTDPVPGFGRLFTR